MIDSLLIANRGEIACRVIRTARAMGIRTIAVYSDADAQALHVRMADAAVHIGPSPARESYLLGDRIIAAALSSGAQAIHPGYGFLSENAAFARAVADAGLIWVGPDAASIDAMGLKDAAKRRMADAGVPVTPGYMGADQSAARLQAEADAIGYPVLIKAVAGGGGKGMRRVDGAADFADALASCQREAASSFGDDRVLLEKYIAHPRHIEVQIFGDRQGNVVHLFERDCSLQRRHQKVVEEAPAPGMDAATRDAICAAAVRAAQAVDYVGAGTIEFIADASEGLHADRIWFMEMNTRLQVEHPVTEAITGVDLVEWQLRIAAGEALPLWQQDLAITGHAVEVRLYAEDPAKGFLPSTGRLDVLHFPDGGRVDTGVEAGSDISPFYDPMIAKLIVHDDSREEAFASLHGQLDALAVWPVRTNAGFLCRLLGDGAVLRGDVDTGLIERGGEALTLDPAPVEADIAAAARLLDAGQNSSGQGVCAPLVAGLAGFRLNRGPVTDRMVRLDGANIRIDTGHDIASSAQAGRHLLPMPGGAGVLLVRGGVTRLVAFRRTDGGAGGAGGDGAILAPMPGRIIAVDVAQGDQVAAGQKLLTLEAMKMEHSLVAPFDGVVEHLSAVVGAQVQVDALLARIEVVD